MGFSLDKLKKVSQLPYQVSAAIATVDDTIDKCKPFLYSYIHFVLFRQYLYYSVVIESFQL